MNTPVNNWQVHVGGITLRKDQSDVNLLHYPPRPDWTTLQEFAAGDKLTTLAGEISFDLTAADWTTLKTAYPGKRFVPLIAADLSGAPSISIPVSPPHVVVLRIVQTLPFPKVVFSATLRKDDADYASALDRLRKGWHDRSLIRGSLSGTYQMKEIQFAFIATLKRDEVHAALRTHLAADRVSLHASTQAVVASLDAHFSRWARAVEPPEVPANHVIRDFLVEEIIRSHLRTDGILHRFDDGKVVPAWVLRNPLELAETSELSLWRSANVNVAIQLL